MNCLKNSRSVLSRLLPRRATTVSPPRPLPAQAPAPRYYYASRLPRENAASCPPPQMPSHRCFFTSRWRGKARRGVSRWYHHPRLRKIAAAVVIVGGGAAAIYLHNLDAVSYTNRTRFIIVSRKLELLLGEAMFAFLKMDMEPEILPPLHPESFRVRRITSEIVRAVDRVLAGCPRREAGAIMLGGSRRKDGGAAATATAKPEDEQRRNHGDELGAQPRTSSLLDGWDVIVVRSKKVNAMCAPGGKIIVYTGLLDILREDAEIATILCHEVGHAIARHSVERYTKGMWHLIVHIVTFQFLYRPDVKRESWLPFRRSLETEADHIGLLLLAAAGYDPRVAPLVYEKLGKNKRPALKKYLSTHPSGKERAQHLLQDEVMNEALEIYREVHSGHGTGTNVFAFAVVLYFVFCFFKG
ncbi:hypothetical protein EJB05_19922, partial [Eragrostis curvula]